MHIKYRERNLRDAPGQDSIELGGVEVSVINPGNTVGIPEPVIPLIYFKLVISCRMNQDNHGRTKTDLIQKLDFQ